MIVSIILPIYNCETHLRCVLDNLINQTFEDFELIAVDDGSTDKSLKVLQQYANIDKRIKIIVNQNNIGLTKSLNKGIKKAKGDYIVRQDADDIPSTNRIEKQLKFLLSNKDYAFCGCNGIEKKYNKQILKYFKYREIYRNLIAENCFIHPSIVIRKSILEEFGYYDENYLYGQDYELWCRLIYKFNLKAMNLNENLIFKESVSISLEKRSLIKFIIQRVNSIKTKLKYVKYCDYKIKGFTSIFIKCLEILTFAKLIVYFSSFLENLNY